MKPLTGYADIKQPKPKPRSRRTASVDPDLRIYVRGQPCILAALDLCRGPIEAAHVKARGAGGKDWDNLLPLCLDHHRESHRIGRRSFEVKYQIRLLPLAQKMTAMYLAERGFR